MCFKNACDTSGAVSVDAVLYQTCKHVQYIYMQAFLMNSSGVGRAADELRELELKASRAVSIIEPLGLADKSSMAEVAAFNLLVVAKKVLMASHREDSRMVRSCERGFGCQICFGGGDFGERAKAVGSFLWQHESKRSRLN